MERVSAAELKVGDRIETAFQVKDKRLVNFRGREGYFLVFVLGDRTGEVNAVLWEGAEEVYPAIVPGDIVRVKGLVKEYAGSPQVELSNIKPCPVGEFNPAEFLPTSPRQPEKMLQELTALMDTVKNLHLRRLLDRFFSDSKWRDAFIKAPAAKKNHQAYLGGLLEHTLQVTAAAYKIAGVYPQVDRDLLVTGAVLHDVGKVQEYSYHNNIDFSDEGRLLGHILLGVQMVEEKIRSIGGFPAELRLKLLHIIASHHGRYEWQSPKRPKFLEAAIIHHLDLLDAAVDMFVAAAGKEEGSAWSSWVSGLDRFIYKK